ncbi:glycosyltransferase family 4 protein [Fulvivirgaceae bacterium BMA10]|uniref:Glycosyltransferase family 4 protein n=1 Tax=Splendidivirga corallicola TaxID=3051826 RepID=A0ABT8KZR9_9BACT|nr:glycosyltransferase family 4 protein [Fulvivirgaceae bacterium BMA10]
MKILIINTVDSKSGAARAANRLHKSLQKTDIDSNMLVYYKLTKENSIISAKNPKLNLIRKIFGYYERYLKRKYKIPNKLSFSISVTPDEILKYINRINPDVVHFHWFNKGFMKLETLKKIKQPIVWTLHDMWAFTGGCHYNQNCEKYKTECGACPVLTSNKEDDLSKMVFRRKHKIYPQLPNFNIVTPSKWLGGCAKESVLLRNVNVEVIPNCIDTNVFKPIDKKQARNNWNLPENKKLILFGALKTNSDPRKGFQHLSKALNELKKENSALLIFGSEEPETSIDYGLETHFVGRINDDDKLAHLYSAADVMVVPSVQENLGNAIMESLACSTPVVAFNIGGNSDMIDHEVNGYLAKPFNVQDLAKGIDWIIEDDHRWKALSEEAHKKVMKHYTQENIANKHLELYRKILQN